MAFVHESCALLALLVLTLILHSAGTAALIDWAKAHLHGSIHQFGPLRSTVLVIRLTGLVVCLHMLEILLWACFYRWSCIAAWESAIYFSAASYSTVGASELVLPRTWRMLCPMESTIGVLMCGLSAGFLFAIVTRLVERDRQAELELALADSVPALALAGAPDQQNSFGGIERIQSSAGDHVAALHPGRRA
jgi:voltage-gated potassium channel